MTSLLSSSRVFLIVGLVALLAQSAYGHTYLSSIFLNNEALNEGDCMRPHPATAYDSPIPLVTSPDMMCGWLPHAAVRANRKCPIAAGSKIGLQWHHQSTAASDDIVDPSHVGPIIVYLAKSETGAGNVWFKIYEDGYANGKWAVDRLIANGGRVDVTLPSDISPGNYLLRGELIALHGAYALNGVQPYVGCVELTISGSGTANPSGVAFPGYYANTDPGMLFDVYSAYTSYIIPGPALYRSGSSSGSSGSSSSSGSVTAAPTTRPTPTTAPPTSAPSGNTIKVGLNSGTSVWWVGVVVSGGGETTVKVEMTDSGSLTSWVTLVDKSYAYVYEGRGVQVRAPLSLRLTSSSGKQVVLTNIFTSLSSFSMIDTGKSYTSTSTTAPTTAPTTRPTTAPTTRPTTAPTTRPTSAPTTAPTTRPTSAPTTAPTNPPSGSNAKVNVHSSSNSWWLALTVSGTSAQISKIEIKDSGALASWTAMTNNQWAYTYSAQGTALVAPLSVRVTSTTGKVVTATLPSITPGMIVETSGQL